MTPKWLNLLYGKPTKTQILRNFYFLKVAMALVCQKCILEKFRESGKKFSIVFMGLLSCEELKSTDWYKAARLSTEIILFIKLSLAAFILNSIGEDWFKMIGIERFFESISRKFSFNGISAILAMAL